MPYFDRFNKNWATSGLIIEPSDAQADAGFAYLGPVPPSVEGFNAMFQWNDSKDNWLYNQISNVILGAGLPVTETDLDALLNAINSIVTGATGNYVAKAGDVMTGNLTTIGLTASSVNSSGRVDAANVVAGSGIVGYSASATRGGGIVSHHATGGWGFARDNDGGIFGPADANGNMLAAHLTIDPAGNLVFPGIFNCNGGALSGNGISYAIAPASNYMAFGWTGARVTSWVDGTYIGELALLSDVASGNYVLKAGDTMTGKLTISGVVDGMEITAASGQFSRYRSHVIGTRIWSAGTDNIGNYVLVDETAGAFRFNINTAGDTTMYSNVTITGSQTISGNQEVIGTITGRNSITADGGLFAHGQIMGLYSDGGAGRYLRMDNAAVFMYNASNGQWSWHDWQNVPNMTMDGVGNVWARGAITAQYLTGSPSGGGALRTRANTNSIDFGWSNVGTGMSQVTFNIDNTGFSNWICTSSGAWDIGYIAGGGPVGQVLNGENNNYTAMGIFVDQTSDERIKTDFAPTDVDALALILQIPVERFTIKADAVTALTPLAINEEPKPTPHDATGVTIPLGLVARDALNDIIPGLVYILNQPEGHPEALPDDLHIINVKAAIPYIIRSIQQLNERIDLLTAE
jgi:hypothetical protein